LSTTTRSFSPDQILHRLRGLRHAARLLVGAGGDRRKLAVGKRGGQAMGRGPGLRVDLDARKPRASAKEGEDGGDPFGDRFVRGALFKLLPYPRRMGPALRLAPLGRNLPLPGQLGVMTEIAPPWRSTRWPRRCVVAPPSAQRQPTPSPI
jgi:hypothetical protein